MSAPERRVLSKILVVEITATSIVGPLLAHKLHVVIVVVVIIVRKLLIMTTVVVVLLIVIATIVLIALKAPVIALKAPIIAPHIAHVVHVQTEQGHGRRLVPHTGPIAQQPHATIVWTVIEERISRRWRRHHHAGIGQQWHARRWKAEIRIEAVVGVEAVVVVLLVIETAVGLVIVETVGGVVERVVGLRLVLLVVCWGEKGVKLLDYSTTASVEFDRMNIYSC
jgi:hypothetical protein